MCSRHHCNHTHSDWTIIMMIHLVHNKSCVCKLISTSYMAYLCPNKQPRPIYITVYPRQTNRPPHQKFRVQSSRCNNGGASRSRREVPSAHRRQDTHVRTCRGRSHCKQDCLKQKRDTGTREFLWLQVSLVFLSPPTIPFS